MHGPSGSIRHDRNQGCFFWFKHSEACANIKIATVLIIAGIAASAITLGALVVLAQGGSNFGGINAIAKLIEAKWLYTGLGVGSAVLLIDAVIIGAMIHYYRNRTFSQEELAQFGIEKFIKTNHIQEKLIRGSYWKIHQGEQQATQPGETGKPAAYYIVVKDNKGKISFFGFKTPEERDNYKYRLGNTYRNGLQLYKANPEYTNKYIEARFKASQSINPSLNDNDLIDHVFSYDNNVTTLLEIKQELSKDLPIHHYRHKKYTIPGTNDAVIILAVNTGAPDLHFFYCKPGTVDTTLQKHYPNYIDRDAALQALERGCTSIIRALLLQNTFRLWVYEIKVNEKTLHAVAYRNQNMKIHKEYVLNPKALDDLITQENEAHPKEPFLDAKARFLRKETFTEDEVNSLGRIDSSLKKLISRFEGESVRVNEHLKVDLTLNDGENIYALRVGKSALYFTTPEKREAYIDNSCPDTLDIVDIKRQVEALYRNEELAKHFTGKNEIWPCEITSRGRFVYVIIDNSTCSFTPYGDQTAFENACLEFVSNKGYVDAKDRREARREYTLDEVKPLISDADYNAINMPGNKLEKGQYQIKEIKASVGTQPFYAVYIGDAILPHLFRNKEACTHFVKTTGCYDFDELKRRIDATAKAQRVCDYPDEYFIVADYKINEIDVFVTMQSFTVRDGSQKGTKTIIHNTFPSAADRDKIVKHNQDGAANTVFETPDIYKNEYISKHKLIDEDHWKLLNSQAQTFSTKDAKFATYVIPQPNLKGDIFTLVYTDVIIEGGGIRFEGKIIHFTNDGAREKFMKDKLGPRYADAGIPYLCFGPPDGMKGENIAKANSLELLLVKPGDAFTFEHTLNGRPYYLYIYRDAKGELKHGTPAPNANPRTYLMNSHTDVIIVDRTAFVKRLDHKALAETIAQTAADKSVSGMAEGTRSCITTDSSQNVEIVYFKKSGEIHAKVFEPGQAIKELEKIT